MTELKYQISSEEAARLRSRIPLYLKTVFEKDWKESSTKPYDLPAWKFIAEMQAITRNWDTIRMATKRHGCCQPGEGNSVVANINSYCKIWVILLGEKDAAGHGWLL